MKRIAAVFLCVLLLISLVPAAFAAGGSESADDAPQYAAEREIRTAEEFLRFAEDCSRESFSLNTKFTLTADIDLTGASYEGAGYFAGCFDGGGHTISGLSLTRAGSRQGLFRQIAPGAVVENLNVVGSVEPDGTRSQVGGIVGVNEGVVRSCSFSGSVSGAADVGGIAGVNSGMISSCRFDGQVLGEHQVGGVSGQSSGVLYDCRNTGDINTVAVTPTGETRFDLAVLSQDDFVDISNIAGVVGLSSGVVSRCVNLGDVGYKYTGYNVGGIAGKSGGFVSECRNDGSIEGRRDVGGIVGQSIPYAAWELSESKIAELSKAIGGLNGLLAAAIKDADDDSDELHSLLAGMTDSSKAAVSALEELLKGLSDQQKTFIEGISVDPETGEIILPAPGSGVDTAALTKALTELYTLSEALRGAVGESVTDLAEDIRKISGQMSYVFNTLYSVMDEASAGDLITVSDISLDEAYDHDEGAVADCENRGAVRAETNAGGVVGTIAFEIEFDMEDKLASSGALPSHADRFLFAVIRGCKSSARVQSRGDNAGGVVGRMDLGAVVDCVSAGSVVSQSGDCVGGVAGVSAGTLCRCWSRSELEGGKYIGGTAGRGDKLTDCRAWTHIARGAEYLGAVAGWADGEVSGNLYVDGRPDGVDGVSRIGMAEPVGQEEFLALDGAPGSFDKVTVRFTVEGKVVQKQTLPFGAAVEKLPAVADRDGAYWVWDDFEREHVYADTVVTGSYRAPNTTISSGEAVPLFLVEGEFGENQRLLVQPFAGVPDGESAVIGGYTLSVNGFDGDLRVRMRSTVSAAVIEQLEDGSWRELPGEWDGNYLIFTLRNGGSFAVVGRENRPVSLIPVAAGGAGLLALVVALRLAHAAKKKKAAKEESDGQ